MPKAQNEGYLGNINVKRAGVSDEWSEEKILEYKKCTDDPAYFIQKYVKIISLDEGLVPFKLYEYQDKLINHFHDNRFNIVLACRQSGISITTCAYLLWYSLAHPPSNKAFLKHPSSKKKFFAEFFWHFCT